MLATGICILLVINHAAPLHGDAFECSLPAVLQDAAHRGFKQCRSARAAPAAASYSGCC